MDINNFNENNENNENIEEEKDIPTYNLGDIVECKYKQGFIYYRGTIKSINKDNSYDIIYEGGDIEYKVNEELIRIPEKRMNSIVRRFMENKDPEGYIKVGMVIEARFAGRDRWFKGEISRVAGNNSFDVIYDKGRKEAHNVKRTAIRLLPDEPSSFKHEEEDTTPLDKGQAVEARNENRKLWEYGYISKINEDGTYDILYNDQHIEEYIPRKYIRTPL